MLKIGRKEGCPHCAKLKDAEERHLQNLILDRPHSIVVVGDHQYFPGYCMVISKHHAREMHELSPDVATDIFHDVMNVGAAITSAFQPWKINYASLGNVEEHLHWHVIPRYTAEQDHRDHPWKNSTQFLKYQTSREAVERVRKMVLNAWKH